MSDDHSLKQQQRKTVDDIQLTTWNNIVKMLDLSTDNDWEKIARYFSRYFTLNDIARIKNDQRAKVAFSPAESVLETLRHNLVPISKLYKCFVEFQLIAACNYLEEAFPAEILYKRPPNPLQNPNQTPAQTVPNSENNNPSASSVNPTIQQPDSHYQKNSDQITASISERPLSEPHHEIESVKLVPVSSSSNNSNSISPNRSVSMNICPTSSSSSNNVASNSVSALGSGKAGNNSSSVLATSTATLGGGAQTTQEQAQSATLQIISLFESILPVISDTAAHDVQVSMAAPIGSQFSAANPSFANTTDDQLMSSAKRMPLLSGKFDLVNIQSRRLSFMRREFNTPFDYIRELKMVKYKHANLLTPEAIFKSSTAFNYFLLYKHETCQTNTLNEIALKQHTLVDPSQYNPIQQLTILRDIAGAVNFLHDRHVGNSRILHGRLHPDSVLVEFRGNDQFVAKLFDFTNAIELNDTENHDAEIRDEFFKFGLLIFLTATWRYINKTECDHLHLQRYEDKNLYLYSIYSQYEINKQPNQDVSSTLFRMFFAITASDYDITKGLHKGYDIVNNLLDRCLAEKSKWA